MKDALLYVERLTVSFWGEIDLAPYVHADLAIMARDAKKMRGEKPFAFTNLHTGEGEEQVF